MPRIIGRAHEWVSSYLNNWKQTVNCNGVLLTFLNIESGVPHVNYICRQLYDMLSMLRRVSKIFPQSLLVKVYKTFIQPKIDYCITVWGFTTESNLNRIQRIQNHAVRIILNNFDYVNTRGIDLVRQLGLFDIRSRRDYFTQIFMFKAIHGLTPHYNSDCLDMNFDKWL